MPFVDTAASGSFLSCHSILGSTISERSGAGLFVTADVGEVVAESLCGEYKAFRRNMRAAFNLVDLTSSEESGEGEAWSDESGEEFECVELVDGDSCASARRRLNEGFCVGGFVEDDKEYSAGVWTRKKLFFS